jgi:hypothetical protein
MAGEEQVPRPMPNRNALGRSLAPALCVISNESNQKIFAYANQIEHVTCHFQGKSSRCATASAVVR